MSSTDSNPSVPALFLHIRKTAGTSIVQMAMDHYGYENVCSHGAYMGKSPSGLKKFPFISGHFGYDFAQALMPDRFSFTFLRDPIERIISLYCFCRTRDPEEFPIYRAASDHDLNGFLQAASDDDLVRSYISNSQVWCLASGPGYYETVMDKMTADERFHRALTNAGRLSFIGFTETFEDDARLILHALKMKTVQTVRHDNVTQNKIAVSRLPARTRQLLEELTQWDRKLYDTLFKKFKGNPVP